MTNANRLTAPGSVGCRRSKLNGPPNVVPAARSGAYAASPMMDRRGIDGDVLLHDSCHSRYAAPSLRARATSRHNFLGREPRQLMRRLIVIALFIAGIAAVIHFADFGTATAA